LKGMVSKGEKENKFSRGASTREMGIQCYSLGLLVAIFRPKLMRLVRVFALRPNCALVALFHSPALLDLDIRLALYSLCRPSNSALLFPGLRIIAFADEKGHAFSVLPESQGGLKIEPCNVPNQSFSRSKHVATIN
jgi:hypothetical protein